MKMSMNGGQFEYTFQYNDQGIRTSKISSGVEHRYTLNGTQIVAEQFGSHYLVYLYDESGAPIGLQYRVATYSAGEFDTYYFEKNIFGDIIAVYTEAGVKIGSYTYDAWGNCTYTYATGATTMQKRIINTLNPFRYRGYYYDYDMGLYYLQSRYYNPVWGRFLNADGYVNANGDLIGFNMYAYCGNNPVMGYDPSGYVSWWGVLAGALIATAGIAIAVASYGIGSSVGAALVYQGGVIMAATGIFTMGCAIEETVMVMDVSGTDESGNKQGLSLVVDFENETLDLYGHHGKTEGISRGSSASYAVGLVFNYDEVGDYAGPFVNVGGSIKGVGVDYCRSPDLDPESCHAVSVTVTWPYSTNLYGGADIYYQIWSWEWD